MRERARTRRIPAEFIDIMTNPVTPGSNDLSVRSRLCLELIRDVFESGLTKKQKCYIMLYYRDGLTMQEIADRYSVNRSTVSRTISAARRRFEKRAAPLFR